MSNKPMPVIPLEKTIGDKGIFTDGNWILSSDMSGDGTIRLIQLADIGIGSFLNKSSKYISVETFEKLGCTELREGDVLISRMADPIARACILPHLPTRCITAVDVTILRTDPQVALPKYIKFVCNSQNFRDTAEKLARGTTRKRISRKELGHIKIPLPTIREQEHLVSILERAEKLKELRENANEDIEKIIQAVFYELFGDPILNIKKYPVRNLIDVCKRITDGSHFTPKILEEGYPFLTVANMGEKEFYYEDCKRISEEDYTKLVKNDCKPLKGDVLFSKDGTVGKVMEITKEKDEVVLSSIAILRPNTQVLPTYLAEFLKTDYALNQAIGKKTGSAIRRIVLKDVKQIKIIVPTLDEQDRFVRLIKQIQSVKQTQKQSTQEINTLFDAIMQKAFSGELSEV